jgi:hypothetical protein
MVETCRVPPETYSVNLDGRVLRRGFWLYVWDVTTPDGSNVLYVGRTGDSSSANAQSPFARMGQHLGRLKNSSMLRNHLEKRTLDPEDCTFRLVAHGPVLPEVVGGDMAAHVERRDVIAALEKQLAEDLDAAGYDVMNEVRCNKPLDQHLYAGVRAAFAQELHRL